MKRKIIAFLHKDPKTEKSTRSEVPQIREAVDGRNFTVIVAAGFYDEQQECYFEEDSIAVWGDSETLTQHLKIGRNVLVS